MYTKLFKKINFGSKKYLTSKSSEVQKAQNQAPKQTVLLTALFAPVLQRETVGRKAGKMWK